MTDPTYRPIPSNLKLTADFDQKPMLRVRDGVCSQQLLGRTHVVMPHRGIHTEPLGAVIGVTEKSNCMLVRVGENIRLLSRRSLKAGEHVSVSPAELAKHGIEQFVFEDFCLAPSTIEGIGLFPTRKFLAGEKMCCTHIKHNRDWLRTPYGGFYNHPTSEVPACCFTENRGFQNYLFAATDVAPRQEAVSPYKMYTPVPQSA